MAGSLERLRGRVARIRERHRERPLLEATMAVSALVATADREVRLSEEVARDFVLENTRRLQAFDPEEAVELHRRYVEILVQSPEQGRRRAFEALARFQGDPDSAALLVSVGLAIAKADSEVSPREDALLSEICEKLNIARDEISL